MSEGRKPLPGPAGDGGRPLVRGVFLPARDWQIEDTWYVAGLKGTGSHHITLRDTIVSAANVFDLANAAPCLTGPLYQAVPQFLPLMHSASSVGMAEGALDELVELAKTGRQQQQAAVPMRDSETFQGELGRIAADLRAARAFLQVQAASHWRHALIGTLKGEACHTGHPECDMARNYLRARGRCVLRASWQRRDLRDLAAATTATRPPYRRATLRCAATTLRKRGQGAFEQFRRLRS